MISVILPVTTKSPLVVAPDLILSIFLAMSAAAFLNALEEPDGGRSTIVVAVPS